MLRNPLTKFRVSADVGDEGKIGRSEGKRDSTMSERVPRQEPTAIRKSLRIDDIRFNIEKFN